MSVDSTAQIHPSAVIEPGARIGAGCEIGPFCWIGAHVELAENVVCTSHVVIRGQTKVGSDTRIFSFAVIGEIPQDLKFKGEVSQLEIGQRNTIREHVTINLGTQGGGGVTSIGDDCLLMAGCHIAHDARLGNRVIIVNSAAIAGHVVIEDDVIVGGLCGVGLGVVVGHTDKHEDPGTDLAGDLSLAGDALDRHRCPADPLHQSSHRSQPTPR